MSSVAASAPASGGLALVWAQARGGVIGNAGTMPWHIPEDLRHFKDVTGSAAVIMGRRTWESLPEKFRPLPGRRNIVVSRDPAWAASAGVGPEVGSATSLGDALRTVDDGDTWVIGGAEVYHAAMPLATRLEITEIDLAVDGDTFAPPVDASWVLEAASDWFVSRTGPSYRFLSYSR